MTTTGDFWIGIGDLHGDTSLVRAIPDLEHARGVIVSGDITIRGNGAEAGRVLEAIAARNPRILAQIGNMDMPEVDAMLDARQWNIHGRALELAPGADGLPSVGLIGVGASTPTPFGTPSEYPDSRIAAWLEQAYAAAPECDTLLLVSHDPPHESVADRLPNGSHVGSRAVRAFIEKAAPAVCLAGHIHESRGIGNLGATLVINPGPLAEGGYARIVRNAQGLTASLERIG